MLNYTKCHALVGGWVNVVGWAGLERGGSLLFIHSTSSALQLQALKMQDSGLQKKGDMNS